MQISCPNSRYDQQENAHSIPDVMDLPGTRLNTALWFEFGMAQKRNMQNRILPVV